MDRLIQMILRRVLMQAARKMASPEKGAAKAPDIGTSRKQMQMARRLGRMVGRL